MDVTMNDMIDYGLLLLVRSLRKASDIDVQMTSMVHVYSWLIGEKLVKILEEDKLREEPRLSVEMQAEIHEYLDEIDFRKSNGEKA